MSDRFPSSSRRECSLEKCSASNDSEAEMQRRIACVSGTRCVFSSANRGLILGASASGKGASVVDVLSRDSRSS